MEFRKRKRIVVDGDVQGAVVHSLLVHWAFFFGAAFTAAAAMHFFQTFPNDTPRSFGDLLAAVWQKNAMVFVVLLAMMPIFVRDMLKISHRFVGPIVRIRNGLKQLADGDRMQEIELRTNDHWKDLAEVVNRIAARIRKLESAQLASIEAAPAERESKSVPVGSTAAD